MGDVGEHTPDCLLRPAVLRPPSLPFLQQPVDLGDQTGQSLVLGEDHDLLPALPVQDPAQGGGHLLQTLSHLRLENDPLIEDCPAQRRHSGTQQGGQHCIVHHFSPNL